ncbi:DEAD/DEAH box helicase [Paenibacillus glycinis]|uniref:DEAD/DEAH box helicase n=1 Tax=Paenibacillus glycinis TaxID=2697035 RepID=A0ABW9XRM4_9BACL|nr:DEAD/DEAH box helicase [Paenibacillus glycinis]NBD25306.1 DEAD/DEAH box helicase [Paenibacillus glycinis]
MASFEQLGIAKERAESLRNEGITEATPIQEGAIPVIMQGSDVICQAQTGTGKTLAFLLPMLEKTRADRDNVQGLILTPTRELALQITTELKNRLADKEEFSVLAVYGGQDVESQLRKLKRGVHLVVATPGRLLDHIRRGTIALGAVKMLVLDEADQMLHMGFLTEVEEILTQMPYRKQTMLFSATMPSGVRSLAARFMIEPKDITVRAPQVTVKGIRQLSVEVDAKNKQEQLKRLLEEHNPYLGVIFCRTKKRASALNEYLQENGFNSDELHGDLSQAKREQVMKRFRDAKLHLLVATDVAARGLDVEGVTHVFNYDIPENAESYIHRIGRTGRAGESGLAITLVSPHDRLELAAIERGIQMSIPREGRAGGAPARATRESGGRTDTDRPSGGRGAGRRGATSGGGFGRGAQGGRSGQAGRGGRTAAGGGRAAGAYAAAAKRGSGTDEPQWGAGRADAPRGGRTRYSTPAGEAAGEARGRGASGSARGGAGREAGYGARSGGSEARGRGASGSARGGAGREAGYGARSGGDEARGRGASASARGGAGREAGYGARSGGSEARGRGASGSARGGAGREAGYGARSGGSEARGRGASAPARGGAGRAGAPQFPGSGDKSRGGAGQGAEYGARGGGETRGRGASAPRSGGSGRSASGGRSSGGFKGGRPGGKQGAGGRPQRSRTR